MADAAPAVAPAPAGGAIYDTPPGVGGAIDTKSGAILSGPMAGQQAAITPAPASSLITTSNASRANFSSNVTGLNNALSSLSPKQTYNFVDASGKMQQVQASSPDEAMKIAPNIDAHSGVQLVKPGSDGAGGGATGGAGGGDTGGGDTGGAGAGASGGKTGDGSITGSPSGDSALTGLPPGLQGYYRGIMDSQQMEYQNAQTTLSQAAATMQNDPAALAAVATIQSQFQPLIDAMKAKNAQVLGRASESMAAFGGLGVMPESFMSNQMSLALNRVADLYTKMSTAILRSNAAYQAKDVRAFNAAQTAVEKIKADQSKTLADLLKATNDHVKSVQAQAKIDAATAKASFNQGVTAATKAAPGMVEALNKSGITDEATVSAYIKKMAQQLGVDPDILAGQVASARQTAAKTSASLANTKSIIAKRGSTGSGTKAKGGGTDGGYTYTGDDIATYTSLMNKGGTAPNGTKYAPRGTDGFVDPGTYTAAYTDWVKNGGTPGGFIKKFPVVTNVNPDSIANLPQALRPKTKTGAPAAPPP